MNDYSEDRRIIKQAIDDNKLVIFVGAGASRDSGVPLWQKAIEKIYDKLGATIINKDETLKIPQIYYNERGEKEFNELIKDIFKFDDKKPNKIHDCIVKLKPCHVITTNYDDFLEKAFINNGEFLDVIQQDSDIPYCKNGRMIIKMHGGFINNNFVLKEDDYLNYSQNFSLIETYIKALVTKNVVLFIGYSYNDPDTKQIFNWVKNILGNNFQRSYFLDGKNGFDLHTVNYYKNLGINIIYSSGCINEHFRIGEIYDNTIKLLDYIIKDEPETDLINIVNNATKHLIELNYVLAQYIPSIFENMKVVYKQGSLKLLSNISEELFEKLNNEELLKDSNKLYNIKKVLDKTIIKNAYIDVSNSGESKVLCYFNEIPFSNFYKDIDNQNFTNIKKYCDSVKMFEEVDNQKQLRVAHCLYELEEYEKCYAILKNVSLAYKQQQNYVWYFIVEFNRLYVGQIINSRVYLSSKPDFTDEIEKINLSDILYNNALKGKNENRFLKDLENFTLMYQTLSKVLKTYEEVEKDANTNYIGGHGIATIDILEASVEDFHNYLKYNHLLIEIYSETREVYKQYINAVFYSHSKQEKEFVDGTFGSGKNIVLTEISSFAITIICKYIDAKYLDKIFKNNNIKKIKLSSEAKNKLFEILDNLLTAIKNKIFLVKHKNTILVFFRILGLSDLNQDDMAIVLNKTIALMVQNYFQYTDFYENMSNFIVRKYNCDKNIITSESLLLIINTIFDGLSLKKWNKRVITSLRHLLSNACYMLHDMFPSVEIKDIYYEAMLECEYEKFLPILFSVASVGIKENIVSEVKKRLESEQFNYSLYYSSVSANIIPASKEMEDRLFIVVIQAYEKQEFSEQLERILTSCINLHLCDKLFDGERLMPYLKDYPNFEFLLDMDSFNYSDFQLSWFEYERIGLKKNILKNQIAFKEIKKLYRKALESNDYDQQVLDDYLNYFDIAE